MESSVGVLWPKIATTEIKYKCLNDFKEAMSNSIVEQITCVVCACLRYRIASTLVNIGCIPNQHMLYPNDDLPHCVIRLNVDIDPYTKYIQITGS
jgi:hypothetical protein